MQYSAIDVERRMPVWDALSKLFLDTDVRLFEGEIVRVLAASPYSLEELDEILLWEVYPACRSNLTFPPWIGGEWRAFDPDRLKRRILRGPSWFMIAYTAILGRLSVTMSVQWRRVKRGVRAMRN